MVRVYATAAQYAQWPHTSTPPGDVDQLLTSASLVIDGLLDYAVFDADATGAPTDPEVVQALAEAVCAQADYMTSTRNTSGTGLVAVTSSASIGSVSTSRTVHVAGARQGRIPEIAPRAWEILRRCQGLTFVAMHQ